MNAANEAAGLQRLLRDMNDDAIFSSEALPLRERVLNRLADLMFCADDVLQMIAGDRSLTHCEMSIRNAYEDINNLMRTLCD